MSIYNNKDLKFQFDNDEYEYIEKSWDIIKSMKYNGEPIYKYRSGLIENLSSDMTISDFLKCEKIIEKLYWNMKHILKNIIGLSDNSSYDIFDYNENSNIFLIKDSIISKKNYYESYINKMIIIDDKESKIYVKNTDYPFYNTTKNKLESVSQYIMNNRSTYESIIQNHDNFYQLIDENNISEILFFDYGFPNLNTIKPFVSSDKFRRKKMYEMYYGINPSCKWSEIIQ